MKNPLLVFCLLTAVAVTPVRACGAEQAAELKRLDNLLLHTQYAEADALAKKLLAASPNSAPVRSGAGQVSLALGRYDEALREFETAVRLDARRIEPRAWQAELLDLLGRRDDAVRAAEAVIEFYNANAKEVVSARELGAVAAALELVNAPQDAVRLLTKAQRADAADTGTAVQLGRLFLGKGQVTDASREFQGVLRTDAKHPEALTGMAACAFSVGKLEDAEKFALKALEDAPNSTDAHNLLAAMAAQDDDFAAAEAHAAKSLAVNPKDLDAHAILAGCHLVRGNKAGYEREEKLVQAVNPRCADFYTAVGVACVRKRRTELAEQMFRTAVRLDPQAHEAMAELGQALFREAKYKEAKDLLEQSHRIDGFNVRTFNALTLLDEMEKYAETDAPGAGRIRLNEAGDGLMAAYVKELATRSLDELWRKYGVPPQPLTIEVLPTQRYFAARVIGLPHLGAIGVCFGRVVAFTSPREQHGRLNWRETAKHELTHAVTLIGTGGRISHWLTEGLAVREQRTCGRPYDWDILLKTSGRLGRFLPVRDLTRAFTRPRDPEQRMLAYCESEIVADVLIEKCGEKNLPRLLAGLREGKELPAVIQDLTGWTMDQFENECSARLDRVTAALPVLPHVAPADEKRITEEAAKNPSDADAQCNLALARAAQQRMDDAAKAADRALAANPQCAEAHYIRAQIAMTRKDTAQAEREAQAAVKCNKDYAPAHYLLGRLATERHKPDEAIAHLREAVRSQPNLAEPYDGLVAIYREKKKEDKAAEVLEELIRNTSDSFPQCVELGRHYIAKEKWADAARAAQAAIGIGPFFAEPHRIAGQALWELGKEDEAIREMEAADRCAAEALPELEESVEKTPGGPKEPTKPIRQQLEEARKRAAQNCLRLAQAYLKKGKPAEAKKAALRAFDLDPNDEAVKTMMERLKGK